VPAERVLLKRKSINKVDNVALMMKILNYEIDSIIKTAALSQKKGQFFFGLLNYMFRKNQH